MSPTPDALPFIPRVCGMSSSGNCHKVRLILEWLGRPYEWIETDTRAGTTQTAEFLGLNPNGKVPVVEVAPARWLAESNAILIHLAEGSPFYPTDAWERAQALQWLFFEQYSHEPYVAVVRFIVLFTPPDSPRRATLPGLVDKGDKALAVMEKHLAETRPRVVCRRHPDGGRHRPVRLHRLGGKRGFRHAEVSGRHRLAGAPAGGSGVIPKPQPPPPPCQPESRLQP